MSELAYQQCISPDCGKRYGVDDVLFSCAKCSGLLDVRYDWSRVQVPKSMSFFESRWVTPGRSANALADFSGVWRFRELLPFSGVNDLVTIGEGRTLLQQADELAGQLGMKPGRLFMQYEGFNPSGSFKDNGMAAAFTVARKLGKARVACASTGNTSAAMAVFARQAKLRSGAPIQAVVFVGSGKIAYGKLAQALDYGAQTVQIEGDFDTCMSLVQQAADRLNLYLMNSVNPFRLEGQKSIMYRVLEGLGWEVPDWIVVPGGNLGNSSAFGKAFWELKELGLVDRLPRLAIVNAAGASTLHELFNERSLRWNGGRVDRVTVDRFYAQHVGAKAKTIASAIEIGRPVNLTKALRSLEAMQGVVRQVSDEEILDGKALVGSYGYGCEPASGASVVGLRQMLADGTIAPSERVVCILTGHALKDPNVTVDYHSQKGLGPDREYANPPIGCTADIAAIEAALSRQ
jgi:threonine synthase